MLTHKPWKLYCKYNLTSNAAIVARQQEESSHCPELNQILPSSKPIFINLSPGHLAICLWHKTKGITRKMSGNNSHASQNTKGPYCDNQCPWAFTMASTLVVYALSQSSSRHTLQVTRTLNNQDHKFPRLLKVSTQMADSRASCHKHIGISLLPTYSMRST